uniref:aldehyde dehydrogenase family protein n=1 Tax=Marinilabilia sp. TaxID=2021252 RepID=UPI0025C223D2
MNFYRGQYQKATSNFFFENINPATGEKICDVEASSEKDVQEAITSATEGFKVWSKVSATERGRILRKAADLLRARNEEIAKIEVADVGKPLSEAIEVDVMTGADALEYFGGIAPSIHGEHYDLGNTFAFTRREPLGVCAGIG